MSSTKTSGFTANSVRHISTSVVDINEKWIHAGKKCERYTLFAVERGELRVYTSAGTLTVGASEALVLSPMTRIKSAQSQDIGLRFFCTELELAQDYMETMTLYSLSAFDFEILKRLVKIRPENEQALADALLFSLLSNVKKAPATEQEKECARIISRVLEDNLLAECDIDKLAEEAGVSRAYLLRAFTEATGKTPKAYTNEKRVEYARALLTHSAFTVSKIAALLRFDDANLFTKFFTYHTGVTPSDYRRALNNIPARSKRGE